MNWKNNFKEGKELVLATCSKTGKPNANVVISLGFDKDKLMIADCSMTTTIKNLKENPQIVIVNGYLKIIGKVKTYSSGKEFNKCVKIVTKQDKTIKVKNAIFVDVINVIDMANLKKIV